MARRKPLFVSITVTLDMAVPRVWEVITTPSLVKEYMYGAEPSSQWKEGKPIVWNLSTADRHDDAWGMIERIKPRKLLKYSFFWPGDGLADIPSNYTHVTYELKPKGRRQCVLTVTQGDFSVFSDGEQRYKHALGTWEQAIERLKAVLLDTYPPGLPLPR